MCEQYNYKGLKIYRNYNGSKFQTEYFTIVNPKLTDKNGRKCHVHTNSRKLAERIVDCFNVLNKYGCAIQFQKNIRNKACRLMGLYIKS